MQRSLATGLDLAANTAANIVNAAHRPFLAAPCGMDAASVEYPVSYCVVVANVTVSLWLRLPPV